MKILFLTGPHAVGKSTLMQRLAQKIGCFTFDTGPHMRKMHREQASNISIGEWVERLESEYGPFVTCDMLCKKFEKEYDLSENVIITGFRQIQGILYMIDYFKPSDYEILYIDADINLLKSNYEKRKNKKISDKEFLNLIKDEEEWGLSNLKKYIYNNPKKTEYFCKKSNNDSIDIRFFDKTKNL